MTVADRNQYELEQHATNIKRLTVTNQSLKDSEFKALKQLDDHKGKVQELEGQTVGQADETQFLLEQKQLHIDQLERLIKSVCSKLERYYALMFSSQ